VGILERCVGSGSEATGCSCAVVVVGEELPIDDVVEKYAEVGAASKPPPNASVSGP